MAKPATEVSRAPGGSPSPAPCRANEFGCGTGLLADAVMFTFQHNSRLAQFFAKAFQRLPVALPRRGSRRDRMGEAAGHLRNRALLRRALRCQTGAQARTIIETNPRLRRPTLNQDARFMAHKNERVELEMKIMKYRALARQAGDDVTRARIKELVAELERKLREIDE
jgi:hypothetical protein